MATTTRARRAIQRLTGDEPVACSHCREASLHQATHVVTTYDADGQVDERIPLCGGHLQADTEAAAERSLYIQSWRTLLGAVLGAGE